MTELFKVRATWAAGIARGGVLCGVGPRGVAHPDQRRTEPLHVRCQRPRRPDLEQLSHDQLLSGMKPQSEAPSRRCSYAGPRTGLTPAELPRHPPEAANPA